MGLQPFSLSLGSRYYRSSRVAATPFSPQGIDHGSVRAAMPSPIPRERAEIALEYLNHSATSCYSCLSTDGDGIVNLT
ncbi:hypothetical protein AVDCRST_MAG94-5271 [uncultured Leptolyngbya sp.]|uniref:Uncharacterized protein n=1 Tax=uncultured Leptolyngbya sp. TaxID=332963 RepID=A0A6J4NLG9_9CYAN|nr:hypothetical protein AVDCRST_MAG94-5271 [uncultured Leptolyngbya sp.]